jgi:bifunctional non-homologous end joining protein LigD
VTNPERFKRRFVIQYHSSHREHYDFRLEWNGVLKSWAVPKGVSTEINEKRLAVHVEDHPIEYRNFSGEIPRGQYGAGTVEIWDHGFWEPITDVDAALNGSGTLKFLLHGERLNGKWVLVKLKDGNNWLLIKEKD